MADRYVELFRLPSKLCFEGCPIAIDAGTLLKDTADGRVLVQLKLCNISVQTVASCIVCITPYEPNGNVLEKYEYRFMDIDVPSWTTFGTREAIYLPQNIARKYEVCVIEVVLKNGAVWKGIDCKWNDIDSQQTIKDYFKDSDLESQYYLEVGRNAIFVPRYINGVYQCTCGVLNADIDEGCISCHRKYEVFKAALDIDFLKEKINIRKEREAKLLEEQRLRAEAEKRRREEEEKRRIEQEKQERIEREKRLEELRLKREESRRKARKVLLIVIPSVLVTIFIILLTTVIIPTIKKLSIYYEAEEYYLSGDYQSAIDLWEKVGNFSDSKNRIEEAKIAQETALKEEKYKEGMELLDNNNYSEAIVVFREIEGYKDSEAKIKLCANETDYQTALNLFSQGKNDEAIELFGTLGDYKDSKDKILECNYEEAMRLLSEEEYQKAIDRFKAINGYKDSDEQYKNAIYVYAGLLAENGETKEAVNYYCDIRDYKDSEERSLELSYATANELLKNKQYKQAINWFLLCPGYENSDKLIMDAKSGYVKEHQSSTDHITYTYLVELVDKGYPGAKENYNNLYKWKVDVIINNGANSVKYNQKTEVDIKVANGEYDTSKKARYVITYPTGEVEYGDWFNMRVGGYVSGFYWNNGCMQSLYREGRLTVKVCDEDGKVLGSSSIIVKP